MSIEAIEALEVGECFVKAERFAFKQSLKPEDVKASLEKMRNTISKQIGRVGERNKGRALVMSQGSFHTSTYDFILCVVVTRTS